MGVHGIGGNGERLVVGQTATTAAPLVITPVVEFPASQWPEEAVASPLFWDFWLSRFDHEREADP
jgi:hypothetical protein